jgi:hypothetical protein
MNVLKSRRFWTFLAAQLIALASLLTGHYLGDPFAQQIAALVIATAEGVAAILIAAYTVEDSIVRAAQVKADALVETARITAARAERPGA